MCSFCEDEDEQGFVEQPAPSGRWSWWRLAADLSRMAGRFCMDVGAFLHDDLSTHFGFVQNRQVDLDDARDFAGEVLSGITTLEE